MGNMILNLLATNTVIGIAIGAAVGYAVAFLRSAKGQKFQAYEGYAITAIRLAEKAVPDAAANKGLQKLDYALKLFLAKYEKATGVKADESLTGQIESWIATLHNALDESGVLKGRE